MDPFRWTFVQGNEHSFYEINAWPDSDNSLYCDQSKIMVLKIISFLI